MSDEPTNLLALTTEIVSAYVDNHRVDPAAIPALIASVHGALAGIGQEAPPEAEAQAKLTPARVRKSITDDAIISFEDGKPYRMLKRHLSVLGMTPAQYIAKWGLPADYPMTAPSYSAKRSQLAKAAGLGQATRPAAAEAPAKAAKTPRAKLGLFRRGES
jgi:predicted transcriptional regulator